MGVGEEPRDNSVWIASGSVHLPITLPCYHAKQKLHFETSIYAPDVRPSLPTVGIGPPRKQNVAFEHVED